MSTSFVMKAQQQQSRTAFRLQGTLGHPGQPPHLGEVIEAVVDWAQRKYYDPLPESAKLGKPFNIGEAGTRVMATGDGERWALRLEQPDGPYRETKAVPGRFWASDVSLIRQDHALYFSMRALCFSPVDCDKPVPWIRPRLVLDLDDRFGLQVGVRPSSGVQWLNQIDDFRMFQRFVADPDRELPVVVVTEFSGDQWSGFEGDFQQMIEVYATRLQCLAQVYAQPALAEELNKTFMPYPWSVFRGGVRLYNPGFNAEDDQAGDHPLFLGKIVCTFRHGLLTGPAALAKHLQERCIQYCASRKPKDPQPLYFKNLESIELQNLAAQSDGAEGLAEKYRNLSLLQQNTAEQLADMEARLHHTERELQAQQEENRKMSATITRLSAHNEELLSEVQKYKRLWAESDRTSSYAKLTEWCVENLSERLILLPRARRGLSSSEYTDIETVARALDLLASEGRDFFLGREQSKSRLDVRLRELGMTIDKTGSPSSLGQYANQYEVIYPEGSSHSQRLDWHLKKGVDRDPRNCLRIYFFFDEERELIVVGSLTKHLQTAAS